MYYIYFSSHFDFRWSPFPAILIVPFSGDIVEVSRVLLLEEEWVSPDDPLHEVVWYQGPLGRSRPLPDPSGSLVHREYVIIPLGYGALYKSPPPGRCFDPIYLSVLSCVAFLP